MFRHVPGCSMFRVLSTAFDFFIVQFTLSFCNAKLIRDFESTARYFYL